MFVVLLTFSSAKSEAANHLSAHNAWLRRGFDDGLFIMSGSLKPGLGGAILACGCSHEALSKRVGEDPFVIHNVVEAAIHDIAPVRLDERLAFLKE